MSTVDYPLSSTAFVPLRDSPQPEPKPSLHRIQAVRKQQGLSIRSVSRRTKVEPRVLRAEEEESSDLTLSALYRWQKALEVPVSDLLEESHEPVSRPVMERARMVKIMKTAAAIRERTESEPVYRMALMLIDQLLEIMPELADISPWHSVGQRRTTNEFGRITDRTVSDDFFADKD